MISPNPTIVRKDWRTISFASAKSRYPTALETKTEKPTLTPIMSPPMSHMVEVTTAIDAVASTPIEPTMAVST